MQLTPCKNCIKMIKFKCTQNKYMFCMFFLFNSQIMCIFFWSKNKGGVSFVKKKTKCAMAAFLAGVMLIHPMNLTNLNIHNQQQTIYAATDSHWYTQKNWKYNGQSLTSLCYITSYAMVLKSMGYDVDPVDVYVANGKSNYCSHATIARYYGVDATSEAGSIDSLSTTEKIAFLRQLLNKYPQGVIVGGRYSSTGTHYIVAKKVVGDVVYFDDPAWETEAQGCCIPISNVYKLTWATIDEYRVVKELSSETTVVTPTPTTTPSTSSQSAISGSAVVEEGQAPSEEVNTQNIPIETPSPKETDKTVSSTAEQENNPLGKYKVPTKTIYYTKPVMKGEDVKWVEACLKKLGYTIKVNGTYTKADQNIVKKYQKKKGLSVDGYVGKSTRKQLLSDIEIAMVKVKKVSGLSIVSETVKSMSSDVSSTYNATAKWTKNTDVTGYVLLYSENSDFSDYKKISKKKNSVTIPDLEKGINYYVKVRAYKKVNGTRVYGAYSTKKKINVS